MKQERGHNVINTKE